MTAKCSLSLPIKLAVTVMLLACLAEAAFAAAPPQTSASEPATFNIFIANPAEGGLSSNDLSIAATVSSTFQLSSVKAQVDGREVSLTYSSTGVCNNNGSCTAGWVGTLSLVGLPRGAKTLTVTAMDVFGNTGQAQRRFVYDQPPRINVTSPIAESVTNLTLHVTARCVDDDAAGCKSMSVVYAYPITAPGTSGTLLSVNQSSIDQDVSLPVNIKDFSSDGVKLFLSVSGTDSAGQSIRVTRTIYVQQHSRLIEVESFNGRILDVQPERVLLLENVDTPDNVLKIRTRSTGEESVIPLTGQVVTAGFLTPQGALFSATDGVTFSSNGRVYDWRDGTLIALTELFSNPAGEGGIKVRGDLVIYDTFNRTDSSAHLFLRSLVSETTIDLARASSSGADLAANGDVVYWSDGNIFRYRNGASAQLTNDAQNFSNSHPVTDGINVVYARHPAASQTNDYTLTLIDAAGARVDLTTIPNGFSYSEYQAAGGWIAFPKLGGGVKQVWTRSPAGEVRQISFFGTDSVVSRLSSNGELTFASLNGAQGFGKPVRLNLYRAGEPLIDVAATSPFTFSLGGQWYAYLGRTLFRLPSASEVAPGLMTDAETGQAIALDSVTQVRDPFSYSTQHNFSADQRTRLILFARNIDWLSVNANSPITAHAEDAGYHIFPLTVERAAPSLSMNWLTEIVVRLPDELSHGGDFWFTVNVGGFNSNSAKITITSAAGTP